MSLRVLRGLSPIDSAAAASSPRKDLVKSASDLVKSASDSLVDLCTGLVYGIDEDGEWYFNGSGKRPEELKKEEE